MTIPMLPRSILGQKLAWLTLAGALVACFPLMADAYWTRLAVFMFVNIGLASAWNIIGGIAGYPSFGHGVFFGVGAYVSAIAIARYGAPLAVAIPVAAVVVSVFALLFAPLFRQRGFFFALSTLAAALAVETIVRAVPWLRGLGGTEHGWNLPNDLSVHFYFYATLVALLLCLANILWLLHSKLGLA